jgi:hypothetical protein
MNGITTIRCLKIFSQDISFERLGFQTDNVGDFMLQMEAFFWVRLNDVIMTRDAF